MTATTPATTATTVDLVVVGSGAAGLTAAIGARLQGLRPLVIEKAATVGGTTALSGGVLWLPANPLMAADGEDDTAEEALRYLQALGSDPAADPFVPERRAAYVATAPGVAQLLSALGVELERCAAYPDYHQELPGARIGRSVEPKPFDGRRLGDRRSLVPERSLLGRRLKVRVSELNAVSLARRNPKHLLTLARVMARSLGPRLLRRPILVRGEALVAQLLHVCLRLGVEVRTGAALAELHRDGGRVVGLSVRGGDGIHELAARHGVVLAAGGYARSDEMRERYARQPSSARWSSASPGDTGDAIREAMRIGAATARMDEAWYSPSSVQPSGAAALHNGDRTKPHSLIVDGTGRRYVNEASNYHAIGRAMYERNAEVPAIPSWLIVDSRHRGSYPFVTAAPSRTPREWLDSGYMRRAGSLRELAARCDIDGQQLEATVARFNGHVAEGRDADFGRGDSPYDLYMGDPANQPNATLGPVAEPPFYAVALYPGDVGTCGGLVTDERSRVVGEDGAPIDGLYAAGNSALFMGAGKNWGAGATLGSAVVFGYIAGREAARSPAGVDHGRVTA